MIVERDEQFVKHFWNVAMHAYATLIFIKLSAQQITSVKFFSVTGLCMKIDGVS